MDVLTILSGNIFLMIPHYCSFDPPCAPTDGYDKPTECTLIGSGSTWGLPNLRSHNMRWY